jgi:hypothetical protein
VFTTYAKKFKESLKIEVDLPIIKEQDPSTRMGPKNQLTGGGQPAINSFFGG